MDFVDASEQQSPATPWMKNGLSQDVFRDGGRQEDRSSRTHTLVSASLCPVSSQDIVRLSGPRLSVDNAPVVSASGVEWSSLLTVDLVVLCVPRSRGECMHGEVSPIWRGSRGCVRWQTARTGICTCSQSHLHLSVTSPTTPSVLSQLTAG